MTRGAGYALAAAVAAATLLGWWLFHFLTDDAFIAFRYASNSLRGWGLTWNPPPFLPVEGYTSFLWVVLLREIWRFTGVAPPEAANVVSLLFGYATLFVGARLLLRMRLPEPLDRHRGLLLALALLGAITNRTFLAWLSSGLETSMFNFFLTWWVVGVSAPAPDRGRWWTLGVSTSATLAALTRPDGWLLVAGAVPVLVWAGWRRRGSLASLAAQAAPLLLVPAHLLWRYATYGAWAPNTYFAKNPGLWPESGLRYGASFLVENGGWLWLGLALAWAGREGWRRLRHRSLPELDEWVRLGVPAGALALHAGYYLLVVGGDHFEYRVLSHLVLLSFLTAPGLASRLFETPRWVFASLLTMVLVSWPIPWTHWWHTRDLTTREETWVLVEPVAPHLPALVAPLVEPFDRWQEWLIRHHVAMRHQEHKAFYRMQAEHWPPRSRGARVRWEPHRPVTALLTVGVPGWVLPEVAILDGFGLNDPIIARQPPKAAREDRLMAHDRWPPPGYVECFEPNLGRSEEGDIVLRRRDRPLTDERIRACQAAYLPESLSAPAE